MSCQPTPSAWRWLTPSCLLVRSVLPSRLVSTAMTALAAFRMCPVERELSSNLISAACGKLRLNDSRKVRSAPRQD